MRRDKKMPVCSIVFQISVALVVFLLLQPPAIAKLDPGNDAGSEYVKKLGCDKVKEIRLKSGSGAMRIWLELADYHRDSFIDIDKDVAKEIAQRGHIGEALSNLGDLLTFVEVMEEIAFGDPKNAFKKASSWSVDYSVALVSVPPAAAVWGTMKTLSEIAANLNKEILSLNLDTFGDFVQRDPRLQGPGGADVFLAEYLDWESNKRHSILSQVRIRRTALIDYANNVLLQGSFPGIRDWQKPKYRNQVRTAANRMLSDAIAINNFKQQRSELKKLIPAMRTEAKIMEKFQSWWQFIKGATCNSDSAESPDKKRELAALRYEFDLALARLREALIKARELSGLSSSLYNQLKASLQAGEQAHAEANKLTALAQQCERDKASDSSNKVPQLSGRVSATVAELKEASSAVCDFGTPQSSAEADQILQGAERAHERVGMLSNSARNQLRQLVQAVATAPVNANISASQLEVQLDKLEQVTAFADQRSQLAAIQRANNQMQQIADSANKEYGQMRTKAAPWLANREIGAMLIEASRIVGTDFENIEANNTVSTYRAIVSANLSRAKDIAKSTDYDASLFASKKQQGWDHFANCKTSSVDSSAIRRQVADTEKTIETQEWAAKVCLQQAKQQADPFGDVESESGEQNTEKEEAASGWGDGSMQTGNSSTANKNDWGAGGIVECVTPSALQAQISSAVAQLQAAVANTDRYEDQIAAVNNLVNAASHTDVCPEIKARVRSTLADLKTANQQEQAANRQENLAAVSRGRAEQQRRRQSWARVASGLTATLQALQNANRSSSNSSASSTGGSAAGTTSSSSSSGNSSSGTTVSRGAGGPNAGNAECDALQRQLSSKMSEWQRLAMQRPTKANAVQWCNSVKRWQSDFGNIMQRAERAGCASLPSGLLAQTRQISQTNCSS
ncbi:MAG: hypothetical protein AB8B48_12410 [Pseudomonadales bacterium]